jgi:hypothetical protein
MDPSLDSPPFTFMSHYYHPHHFRFRFYKWWSCLSLLAKIKCRFYKWVKAFNNWLFELVLSHSTWSPFSCKWRNFIFLYDWIYSLYIYTYTHIHIYHIFLIYSLVVGHLGCFHSLLQWTESYNKHVYTGISLVYSYTLLQIYAQEWCVRVLRWVYF